MFPPSTPLPRILLVLLTLAVLGCRFSPPRFLPNGEGREPDEIAIEQHEKIERILLELFGTADQPRLPDGVTLDPARLAVAAGPVTHDGRSGLYRRHCAVCHGSTGDGTGSAAIALNPYPRDFRLGRFKYTRTLGGAKPTRDDLLDGLRVGSPGSAMPSFARLSEPELEALVDYVLYLSLRGETELFVIQMIVDEDEIGMDAEWALDEGVLPAWQWWSDVLERPKEYVVVPPPRPATDTPEALATSIARGKELFGSGEGQEAQCVKCHGPEGRGDGEESELYDDWNKPKKGMTDEQTGRLARLHALPLQRLPARDFADGVYRGGSRPIDIYRRIHVGIKGTPMPAAGPAPGTPGILSEQDVWHVVNYVGSLHGDAP